jgi:ATP-dependent helicase/nuclease subunit B
MPSLKLFCEPKPDYYFFEQEIHKRMQSGKQDWLAVFPVNRAVRLFSRRLIDHSPNQIVKSPAVFTFDQLLLNLYNDQPESKTVISADLLIFLVEEVLKKLAPQFTFLPNTLAPPARLIQKVTRMITELRRFGYSAAELSEKNAEQLDIETGKLDDFTLILTTLEALLGERYIDLPAARHQAVLNLKQSSFEKFLPALEHIYISGYGLFTPAMYLFIEKVKLFCNVSVKLEFSKSNPPLFENTRPAYERLLAMGAEVIESERDNPLARMLFNRDTDQAKLDTNHNISFSRCDNIAEEVKLIARHIHHIKKEQNIALDKIALTFNPLEKYVPVIQRIFREYKIPFNLSTGYALKQSPLVAVMINLVDMIYENFEFDRVFSLYQSPFLKTAYSYQSISLYKKLISGRVRYLSKNWDVVLLKNLKAKGDWINEPLKEQIGKFTTFLQPFYNFGSHKRPITDFKADFLMLLKKTAILEWYKSKTQHLDERQREREFRAFNKFMKILDQFSWSMQVVFNEQDIDLKTWLQHLKSAVARSLYNLTEWPVEAVQIMPRLEIQAIDYDILFLGGLVDGNFPRSTTADIFFNDDNRQRMGLLANEDLLAQDRFIFFSLLNSANKSVFLSVPRYAGEKALVPSSFLDDLKECVLINEELSFTKNTESLPALWETFGMAIQNNLTNETLALKTILHENDSPEKLKQLLFKIKAQHQRLSLFDKPGIFEGQLSSSTPVLKLLDTKFKNQEWSITKLEDYAFCPMQFFLKRIMGLKEFDDFEEEVSPLERGMAVHTILFRFYNELHSKNIQGFPGENLELLKTITLQELERLPFEGFFWELEKIRYFGRSDSPGLLETFLENETNEIDNSGYIPAHFEFCFGPTYDKEVDPKSVAQLLSLHDEDGNTIQINGKIDRIDINPKTNQALVYDYKTGSIDGKNAQSVATGLSFQLPVYIMAVEQLLDLDLEVVYGGYYQVKDAQNCKRVAAMVDPEKYPFTNRYSRARLPNNNVRVNGESVTFDELIEFSKKTALQKQQQLLMGQFRHTAYPDDKRCSNFCDYKRMCQKYVAKLKHQTGGDSSDTKDFEME